MIYGINMGIKKDILVKSGFCSDISPNQLVKHAND